MMILIDYIDTPVKCTILLFLTGKNNYFSPEKSFTTEQSGRSWSLRRQWVSGLSLPSSLSFCSDFFLSEPAPATLPFFRRILRLRRIMKCEIKAISWCEYHQGKNTNKPLKFPSNNCSCRYSPKRVATRVSFEKTGFSLGQPGTSVGLRLSLKVRRFC